jgi:hypothetical protein
MFSPGMTAAGHIASEFPCEARLFEHACEPAAVIVRGKHLARANIKNLMPEFYIEPKLI